ncbi:carbohydrate-binding protein [Streptomyces sp. NPDC021100]|uniref:carbohydrate-binding protein n=1 Tax=Streptomyces sp. NPDC021100 TaxID=3365114 RepID=UPI0037B710C7
MTAGNNGNGKPEDEDPFGYLYRSEGGDQGTDAAASAPQPGVPRTSYNQVRPVGSRQYTPQQGGATYGAGMPAPQQHTPHYAAPETLPGGAPRQPGPPPGAPGPQRPKRRGLLIAAIAVVVVVAGGIGAAVYANQGDGDDGKNNSAQQTPSGKPSEKPEKKDQKDDEKKPSSKPVTDWNRDAATLQLGGGASTAKDVKGAPSDRGLYVAMKPGASIEWSGVNVPSEGQYTVYINYGSPNGDVSGSLWINGKKLDTTVKLKSWGKNSWSYTYNYVQLNSGKNDIKISCESGTCDANVAKVKLIPGQYHS